MYYQSYLSRSYTRLYKIGRRLPGPKSCQVPGNVFDTDPRKRFKHKFDKWHKLPVAAQKLYWRTHGSV